MAGQNTLTFTDRSFDTDVLGSELPVLVDFWGASGDTSNPANEGHPQNRPIEIGRTSPL